MARNTRAKKTETPKVDIGAEIYASLRELEKYKGISVDYMVERLKQALASAYRKDQGQNDKNEKGTDNVVVDLSEKGLFMYHIKTVVEDVEDTMLQIHIDAARNLEPNAQVGDNISIPVDINKFGRVAAQTAKQVVIQGIREAERGMVFEKYSDKAQELLIGSVLRTTPSGDVIVTVGQGNDQYDTVLRVEEQIPGERYRPGDKLRVYMLESRQGNSNSVYVSRTHPNLVRRLFEKETPEIADGQVEIRNIAREPGSRSKMAVRATQEGIDPVGACVGPRGARVGAVVTELGGEKIDIVVWSEDPCEYVRAALSPAEVISVEVVPGAKASCRVVVPDDQLSLAIGKEGQNARLAAKLTGKKIDIKPESQAE